MNVKVDLDGNAYYTNEEINRSAFFQDSSDESESLLNLN